MEEKGGGGKLKTVAGVLGGGGTPTCVEGTEQIRSLLCPSWCPLEHQQ